VSSVAGRYPISLTRRFSEVHGRVYYHNRFSGLGSSVVVSAQLKQGVNEGSADAKRMAIWKPSTESGSEPNFRGYFVP
jgi:hypothetical protein